MSAATRPGAFERFLLDFARQARAAQPLCPAVPFPDGDADYTRDRLDRTHYERVQL